MQIGVHCDDQIWCDNELIRRVEGVIDGALQRFGDRVFRVEVRLSDLNSDKPGDRDKVCSLEARMTGARPVSARHQAPTLAEAIHVAAEELGRLLGRELRRLTQTLGATTRAGSSSRSL
jgi:hypothetical protein